MLNYKAKRNARNNDSQCKARLYYMDNIKMDLTAEDFGMFSPTASRPAKRPTQPLIRSVPVALSMVAKRPGREANSSPQSSAEVRNA
jgi:hypothetical protein